MSLLDECIINPITQVGGVGGRLLRSQLESTLCCQILLLDLLSFPLEVERYRLCLQSDDAVPVSGQYVKYLCCIQLVTETHVNGGALICI